MTVVPPKTDAAPPWSPWQLRAACRGQDTGIFYLNDRERGPSARRHEAQAKRICNRMPAMLASRQALAASLPAFKPYATMDQSDVDAAARLIGKAHNPAAVKRRVIAIARRKGFSIPDAWQSGADKGAARVKAALHGAVRGHS